MSLPKHSKLGASSAVRWMACPGSVALSEDIDSAPSIYAAEGTVAHDVAERMYTHVDLFSGIGGFALGLERAGFKTIAFCEIDPYCQAVLRKHWPDVPIYEDIRHVAFADSRRQQVGPKLNGQTKENPTDWDSCWQHVDGRSLIVTGGFPCQPWSVAGRRGGADDERHLWPEMLRVIREIHPRWVIAENVPGLDGEQMGLDAVLDDLEDVGYETQTLEIPACAVGAPHIRRRLWIVAHASSAREEIRKSRALERSSRRSGLLRNADSKRQQEQRRPIPGHERTRRQESKLPNWWLTEPDVGRVAHGIPSRVDRLRALGNAIVPQIAEIIGKAIMEVEHGQEKPMAQTP